MSFVEFLDTGQGVQSEKEVEKESPVTQGASKVSDSSRLLL